MCMSKDEVKSMVERNIKELEEKNSIRRTKG